LIRLRDEYEPEEYAAHYTRLVLSRLNPERVAAELGDGACLLCWEPVGRYCHRQTVAHWITDNTGIQVDEIDIIKPRDYTESSLNDSEQLSIL
jgi:uncharacterized protein (DUF488 family)